MDVWESIYKLIKNKIEKTDMLVKEKIAMQRKHMRDIELMLEAERNRDNILKCEAVFYASPDKRQSTYCGGVFEGSKCSSLMSP